MKGQWLIAVDLDGTLFHTDHQISTRTINVMHKVAELGHQFVIVTGRSSHSSVPRLSSVPANARLLCSNGAYEYDRARQKVVWANTLPASASLEIRQRILDQLPSASFGWESASGLSYEAKFIEEAGGEHTLEQGGLNESLDQIDAFKLYVRTPELKGSALAIDLQDLFGNQLEVASSGAPFVEITAAGTHKGAALAKVASELGFEPSHTIAFGDNHNDIAMLQWAGESVAMANAAPELKVIANAHALSNAEEGVAQYLEHKFFDG